MEKAALMNSYFFTIGEKLADELPPPPPVIECRESEVIQNQNAPIPPPLTEITVSQGSVRKIVEWLKINKSSGPDHIPPKLMKLSGRAIVPALVPLLRFNIKRGVIFSSWKTSRLTPIYKKDD